LHNFTAEQKNACLPVVDLILEASNVAREQGILALEEWLQGKEPFLAFMTLLVVDGTDPEQVASIGKTLVEAEPHEGVELLKRLLILEGMKSVQMGEHTRLLEAKLLAMLGEGYLMARGHMGNTAQDGKISTDALNAQLAFAAQTAFPAHALPEASVFCEMIKRLTDVSVQRVLMEVNQMQLAVALKGCDGATVQRFLTNCSARLASTILEQSEMIGAMPPQEILNAQRAIYDLIRRLQDTGEILFK
jgi:hypothetical protein